MLKRIHGQGPWPTGSEPGQAQPDSHFSHGTRTKLLTASSALVSLYVTKRERTDLDFPFLSVRCLLSDFSLLLHIPQLIPGLLSALHISCLLPHIVTSLLLAHECRRSLEPRQLCSGCAQGSMFQSHAPQSHCMSILFPNNLLSSGEARLALLLGCLSPWLRMLHKYVCYLYRICLA